MLVFSKSKHMLGSKQSVVKHRGIQRNDLGFFLMCLYVESRHKDYKNTKDIKISICSKI